MANPGTILVTGGAGFIGSNIVASLCDSGKRVVVCDRLRLGDKWRNLRKRELEDLLAPEQLDDWLDRRGGDLDAVIHMGAISSTVERDADLIIETNFRLSLRLWEWCARKGKRFLYASSAATYGDGSAGFADDDSVEGLARLAPLNAYGWSKHLFDRRVVSDVSAGRPAPPQWAGLKFFNVYGPNEEHKGAMKSVVAQKYPAAAAGEPVTLFKSHREGWADGGQQRDFVCVGDCVDVVLWLLENPGVTGIYNLGSGEARTFEELALALFAALEMEPRIEYVDMPVEIRDKYQYYTRAEMGRLRAAGFEKPFTGIEDGVRVYVRKYLSREDPCR